MDRKKCQKILEIWKKINPKPETELKYNSDFELLIAVILSAQATDISVNKVTKELFAVANTPSAIYQLGEIKFKNYIRSLGLYNIKSKNIIKTCQILLKKYNGKVPKERILLELLPGVGRKTANVVLNVAFGKPTIAVDTHVFRVANRTQLAIGKSVNEIERQLLQLIPQHLLKNSHNWLILHGRYICTARNPRCNYCNIYNLCEFKQKEKYLISSKNISKISDN